MSCYCHDFDILLTVEGITGAVDNLDTAIKLCLYDRKHFRVTGNGGGGGGEAGRAEFEDVVIHKKFDQYSPVLAASVANGQHFLSAVIYFLDGSTGDIFYKVTLREVSFTCFDQMALDINDSGVLLERIKINYNQIEWEWDGVQRCWDISANAAC